MGTVIIWIVLSVILGVVGSDRKIGFAGAFFASLLLSPLIGFIITISSKTKHAEWREQKMLRVQQQQAASMKQIQEQQATSSKKTITEELESLLKMKEGGHLTEDEYQQAKSKVITSI
jgi:uncharacterized membrane protein YraQ (UPF0718 family)